MAPTSLHTFFGASAGVAGALIGLLFVAISVGRERLAAEDASQVHRVRASAALTSFTNALSISLFGLIAGVRLGWVAVVVGAFGLTFVAGSLLSIRRASATQPAASRDALFLLGFSVALGVQLYLGLRLVFHRHDLGAAEGIAILVIVSFLFGISRSWELIGGPEIVFGHEMTQLIRGRRRGGNGPEA